MGETGRAGRASTQGFPRLALFPAERKTLLANPRRAALVSALSREPTSHAMNGSPKPKPLDHDICVHIFTASAAMVGVCITVIGILRVAVSIRHVDTIGDDLLAVNSILYLLTCLLSYWALRTRSLSRNYRLERISDALFLVALTLTTVNAAFLTWAVAEG